MSAVLKRGIGPFTGGQLATVVCVLVVAITFPVGAWAVTSSSVQITNGSSGTHAKVTAGGALEVAGSLTPASVAPSSLYHGATLICHGCFATLASAPAAKSLVITSLWVNAEVIAGNTTYFYLDNVPTGGTKCLNGSFTLVAEVTSPTLGPENLPMATGLAIPAHDALCTYELGTVSSASASEAFVVGYTAVG